MANSHILLACASSPRHRVGAAKFTHGAVRRLKVGPAGHGSEALTPWTDGDGLTQGRHSAGWVPAVLQLPLPEARGTGSCHLGCLSSKPLSPALRAPHLLGSVGPTHTRLPALPQTPPFPPVCTCSGGHLEMPNFPVSIYTPSWGVGERQEGSPRVSDLSVLHRKGGPKGGTLLPSLFSQSSVCPQVVKRIDCQKS